MKNQLHCGDNLSILHEMESGSIDLIATDPPFNTNKDWGQFDDRWGSLEKYLKFMEERAVEMHRVLKDTGSLYLHCDPTASHYLKVMLDGVFGIKQFRNEIVWKRQSGISNSAKRLFSKEHDIILFYTKIGDYVFSPIYTPYTPKNLKDYPHVDENGKRYRINKSLGRRSNGATRTYLDLNKGVPINDLWVKDVQLASSSKERNGYPTQKPIALYERIIKASSNPNDVVLDPFCGSGTTLHAAQRLGRNYIGIDQNPQAIEICQQRLNPQQQELL